MKILLFIFIISVPLMAQKNKDPQTVRNVDLQKYTGVWYEIAKIPNNFQDQCIANTTAEYSLMEDGRIKVINSCLDEDGEIDRAEGVAKVVDKNTNAKLEVSFVSFLGIRPFWGDYWILGLGDNYEYSVVGGPNRKYGWILARERELPREKLDEAFSILKKNGYDINLFEMSKQNGTR
jgi:apolipoprotein D and lipocalin family protein